MLLKIFSIRDVKGNYFGAPFYKQMIGEGERDFKTMVNDPSTHNLHKYPEDFSLYLLGELDNETGKISALDTPQHLMAAIHAKQV